MLPVKFYTSTHYEVHIHSGCLEAVQLLIWSEIDDASKTVYHKFSYKPIHKMAF